uniref:Titin n=1 Tax=Rhabditophanes sp. KR3021 TaxID=114890 RepID=A0AC35UFP8_9BILA
MTYLEDVPELDIEDLKRVLEVRVREEAGAVSFERRPFQAVFLGAVPVVPGLEEFYMFDLEESTAPRKPRAPVFKVPRVPVFKIPMIPPFKKPIVPDLKESIVLNLEKSNIPNSEKSIVAEMEESIVTDSKETIAPTVPKKSAARKTIKGIQMIKEAAETNRWPDYWLPPTGEIREKNGRSLRRQGRRINYKA